MQNLLRHLCANIMPYIVLTCGGLFLISGSKPADASGQFMYVGITTYGVSVYAAPGSSSHLNPGQTSSAASYSYYSAQPGAVSTYAYADGNTTAHFAWVNNGGTPYANGNFNVTSSGSIDGSASPSGAGASSGSGSVSKSAPGGYSIPVSNSTTVNLSGATTYDIGSNLSTSTNAGPDDTADPQHENYGQPTAASAGASNGANIN